VNKNKRMIAAKATTYAIFEGNLDASYSITAAQHPAHPATIDSLMLLRYMILWETATK